MKRRAHDQETLIEKIRTLPADKLAEVENFVDFLRLKQEDRRLVDAASRLSEEAFARVWGHPDDAAYDEL